MRNRSIYASANRQRNVVESDYVMPIRSPWHWSPISNPDLWSVLIEPTVAGVETKETINAYACLPST